MTKDHAARGRANRRKGQGGEREFAKILSEHLGEDITRNLGQERDGGQDLTVRGVAIEVKRRANPISVNQVEEWLNKADFKSMGPAAVAYRADRQPWRVAFIGLVYRPKSEGSHACMTVHVSVEDFASWLRFLNSEERKPS